METKLLCCVMFKNEEEILKRCLDSVKDIVDGYLLVDTGSTDNSLEIANQYEHAYVKEIEFQDFVTTKNEVLDFAEKMPYTHILWMDADEYILEEDVESFQKAYNIFKQTKYEVLITSIHDFHNEVTGSIYDRPRIWKNIESIKFHGPSIHEYIPYGEENSLSFKDLEVYHQHKTEGKNKKETFEFYLDLLHKYENNNPNGPYFRRCLFYIARTYFDSRDWEKCIEYTIKYRKKSEEDQYIFREEYWYSLLDEGKSLKMLGRLDESEEVFKRAISFLSNRAEAYHELALLYYYNMKNPFDAITFLEAAKDLPFPHDNILFINRFCYNHKILDLLGICYAETLYFSKAVQTYEKLLEAPDFKEYCQDDRIINNLEFFKGNAQIKPERYSINNYFDEVYLINLERRKDRLTRATKKLNEAGISFKRMKAYDGQLLKEFVDETILVRRTPGYLGCLLSHLEVIKTAYNEGHEKILILEDDIIIHRKVNEEFERIMNSMVVENKTEWDLFYLGGGMCTGSFELPETYIDSYPINDETRNVRIWEASHVWSGHAYCLSRKLMKWIIDYYEENGYQYELDRVLAALVQRNENFKCYMSFPQLFMQHDTISDNSEDGNHMTNYMDKFLNKQYSIPEYYK